MKVFVIPSGYPNKHNYYSFVYIHEQVKKLQARNIEVVVLDASSYRFNKWFDKNCFKTEKNTFDGVTVLSLHYWGLMQSKLPMLNIFFYNIQLERLFKKAVKDYGKPDIIHAHFSFLSGYCATKLRRKYNIPFVTTEHYSLFLKTKLNSYIKNILTKTVKESERFICVSETLKQAIYKHIENNIRKIEVIPNMVDSQFKYFKKLGSDYFKFFSAGNLIKNKAFDVLIDAFCKTFRKDDNVLLYIAGKGPQYENLKQKIYLKGRTNQIVLLGQLTRKQILEEYIKCDCFVLASRYETFGIVYREALAVGRPVISTKNGGIENDWSDNYGRLVDVDDVFGLSQEMRYMYDNIDAFNCEDISKSCLQLFSPEIVVNCIIQIYKEVLDRR